MPRIKSYRCLLATAKHGRMNCRETMEEVLMHEAQIRYSITALEAALGVKLLDRQHGVGGGVRLTKAGHKIIHKAREIVRLHDEIVALCKE